MAMLIIELLQKFVQAFSWLKYRLYLKEVTYLTI